MKIQTKTILLFVMFLCSLLLHSFDNSQNKIKLLPSISPLVKDDLRKIVITYPKERVVFEVQDDIWSITEPVQEKADYARLRSLFLQFRKEIQMDTFVDQSNHSNYGLDSNNSITIEMWSKDSSDEQIPEIGFYLGFDAEGGSSFVSLQSEKGTSKSVYRAKIGTRARYEYPLQDWMNQILLDFSPSDITQIEVKNSDIQYTITRNTADLFDIVDVNFSVDSTNIAKKITSLGQLRIGERRQFGEKNQYRNVDDTIVGQIILTHRSPKEKKQVLKIHKIENQQALVSIDDNSLSSTDEKQFFIVASSLIQEFFDPSNTFRDRKIFAKNQVVKEAIDRISYTSTSKKEVVELQQDLSNGFWTVLRPSQKSIDMRKIFFMVNTLLSLEAVGIVEEPTQEQRDIIQDRLILHLLGGDMISIGLSRPIFTDIQSDIEVQKYRFVHFQNRILVVSKKDYTTILQGFGLVE